MEAIRFSGTTGILVGKVSIMGWNQLNFTNKLLAYPTPCFVESVEIDHQQTSITVAEQPHPLRALA